MHGCMPRSRLALVVSALVPVAIALANAPAHAGWPRDPTSAVPVIRAPRGQCVNGICLDGHQGLFVIWSDPCTTYTSPPSFFPPLTVRAQHVLGRGDLDPAWPATGATLVTTTDLGGTIAPDAIGGFYVGWADTRGFAGGGRDIYVQHVRSDGTPDPTWPAGGRALCTAPGAQNSVRLLPDGQGGLFAVWPDRRDSVTNSTDIYATRIKAGGALVSGWPVNGRAIYAGLGAQTLSDVMLDGSGGLIVVWVDQRNQGTTSRDIYAAHVLGDGTLDPVWPASGVVVSAQPISENYARCVTDNAGGAFVGWVDGGGDLLAHLIHLRSNGTLDPAWPAGGPLLDPLSFYEFEIELVPDGSGGVIAVWDALQGAGISYSSLARHVLPNGVLDPAWPAAAVYLSSLATDQNLAFGGTPIADGHGGAIVAWLDDRTAPFGLYAQHLTGRGVADWGPTGRAISIPPTEPEDVLYLPDGTGGALLAWSDLRDSAATYHDVYAQRLTEDGHLGTIAPQISGVRDVPGDQGGRATVFWHGTVYDTLPADPVNSYDLWRQLTGPSPSLAARARAHPASQVAAPQPGDVKIDASTSTYWEFLTSITPRGVLDYAYTVATFADSSPAGPANETFVVDVHLTPGNLMTSSDPDSGHSVDNLAPPTPTGFAGTYASGVSQLFWDPSTAPDIAEYRLYRGPIEGFVPSPANRIASPTMTHYTDSAGSPNWYKLTALDIHGNESPIATLLPTGTVGVSDTPLPRVLALARPNPDPVLGATSLRFALPQGGAVGLEIFDIAGRQVRELIRANMAAGEYDRRWDLRDDAGRSVPGGIYFVRLEAQERRLTTHLVVLR